MKTNVVGAKRPFLVLDCFNWLFRLILYVTVFTGKWTTNPVPIFDKFSIFCVMVSNVHIKWNHPLFITNKIKTPSFLRFWKVRLADMLRYFFRWIGNSKLECGWLKRRKKGVRTKQYDVVWTFRRQEPTGWKKTMRSWWRCWIAWLKNCLVTQMAGFVQIYKYYFNKRLKFKIKTI